MDAFWSLTLYRRSDCLLEANPIHRYSVGDRLPGLERLDLGEDPPGRDTWLGYHRDLRRLARLRALIDFVVARLAS